MADAEFAVLILRVCLYAAQFLPSPVYTADKIRGVLLSDIRHVCSNVADDLASICTRFDTRGSLLRVQHLLCHGLVLQCAGSTTAFWETLGHAIQAAQRVGIHKELDASTHAVDEVKKEMRRRTFCNLYIFDRYDDTTIL